MISLEIHNLDQTKRPADGAVGCQLTVSFMTTQQKLGELNELISKQAPLNPGVEFEMKTQLREKYICRACGKEELVSFGTVPSPCGCSPHGSWVKESPHDDG